MIPTTFAALAAMLLTQASPASAQLGVSGTQVGMPDVGGVIGRVTDAVDQTLDDLDRTSRKTAQKLLRQRERMTNRLLRRNGDLIERDMRGDLARKGELLLTGAISSRLPVLKEAGFQSLSNETIEGLGIQVVRLAVPEGLTLTEAETLARQIAPDAEISVDALHYRSGLDTGVHTGTLSGAALAPASLQPFTLQGAARIPVEVGMIDGATGAAIRTTATKGFAKGAPFASNHGSAIASLLHGAGIARVRVADVYGTDPAGGNALAIARGLGWLVANGSKVITISLVGPRNAMLERAIAVARRKGAIVVAAVGNDGPAAPPAYPASYNGVVAITGVDKRNRALIEAGRALNLDYAAPGADVIALNAKGKRTRVRGTSYATPLAAARLAAALHRGSNWRTTLDTEARDLGKKGPDSTYGRGLLCGSCARKK